MPNINIKIRNKVAKGEYAVIVCDNSDYVAHFDFDAEWDAYDTKTARFVYGGKYTDVVFSGNECAVPVMQDTRAVTVGVFAGDLHTTTPAYFACVPSILCGNGIPADPTPDVYNQIMEMLGKISDESVAKAVTDALEQAKVSGEFDGEKGNDGISPAVSVAAITGGNRVTITDAEGAKTFDVMDGAQGASGADGKDYVLTDTDKQEIAKTAAGLVDVPSVQPDWNQNDSTQPDYVKNRPFYEEVEERVVAWDGDTTGKVFATVAQGINLYKVSDLTPTMDEILWGTITLSNGQENNTVTISSRDMFSVGSTNTAWMFSEGAVVSVPADGTVLGGITFPEAGLYFIYIEMNGAKTVRAEWNSGTIHKIAQKYLPDFMMEITTASTYDEVREMVDNDVLPYLQLRSDYSYARLYLSSIESDRFIFGSFPVKYNGTNTYRIELREPTGWGDVEYLYVAETNSSGKELYINSSTSRSTKKFKITVDDSGTITATEVT